MILSEKKVYKSMRSHMKKLALYRIENRADAGTPDILYVDPEHGHTGFIELKFNTDKLRPAQEAWTRSFVNHGGTVWLLAYYTQQCLGDAPYHIKLTRWLDDTFHADTSDLEVRLGGIGDAWAKVEGIIMESFFARNL